MEPFEGWSVQNMHDWSAETSPEISSGEDDDEDDKIPEPRGYIKMKLQIKKTYMNILVEEELIPE